jgi:23S rRNA pseudouridine1911/1915/1917 synthase
LGEPTVLYVDNHLLAVAKPAGVPVVPDSSADESLLEQAKAWLKREFARPGQVFLGVVHRLDRPVSGVVLFARTSKAAARLSEQFRSGSVVKRYLAVTEGLVGEEQGHVEQWLLKDERANRVRVAAATDPGARQARTAWRVLERWGQRTLLELEPSTGRSHQLRAAAAFALGRPLLGDLKYGASAPLPDRSVALHAWRLEVRHPTRDEDVALVCERPGAAWWWPPDGGPRRS